MNPNNADRTLVQRCFSREPGAWNDFVDRFLGLIYHVIRHTSHLRGVPLSPEDTEDVAAEILLQIVNNDYAVLRQFRGECNLSSYLTVIARRTCVRELFAKGKRTIPTIAEQPEEAGKQLSTEDSAAHTALKNTEEVQHLMEKLSARERAIVQLYYLEGRTYEEISTELNIPVNTIGPILSRARKRMRNDGKTEPKTTKPG